MLTLIRLNSSNYSTQGVLIYKNSTLCHTLELPYIKNQKNISCIPCGIYPIKKIRHPKYEECISILNVPNRSGILIHPGNYTRDTRGCILLGLDVEPTHSLRTSQAAVARLYNSLPPNSLIQIKELQCPS